MERKKCVSKFINSFLVIVSTFSVTLSAQSSYKEQIYQAYVNGNMDEWVGVITRMEQANPDSLEEKLELINYYYGYIGFLIGIEEDKKAKVYITRGEKLIRELLIVYPDNAALTAYRGSFLGFKMGINKFKSMVLGPESMKYIKKAYDLNPKDIQAIADKAHMLYYAPSVFGGKKSEALSLYRKGIQLLETTDQTQHNWFYLMLLTTLARQYESMNQDENALMTYQKILQIEPSYDWVKNELYPELMKKMNKKGASSF